MFKQLMRWILPFVAVLVIATAILLTTIVGSSHAAGVPTGAQHRHAPVVSATPTVTSPGIQPDMYLRP